MLHVVIASLLQVAVAKPASKRVCYASARIAEPVTPDYPFDNRPPVYRTYPEALAEVRLAANGMLTDVRIVRSTGSTYEDKAFLRALRESHYASIDHRCRIRPGNYFVELDARGNIHILRRSATII